jgi:hypothetical protein
MVILVVWAGGWVRENWGSEPSRPIPIVDYNADLVYVVDS